jgi:hypothetical protein
MNDENTKMRDVRSSFEQQGEHATVIEFAMDGWSIPSGGHLQGIQRTDIDGRRYFIISGSSDDAAYFIVVGRTSRGYGIVQRKVICREPYRHAGGIQVIGDYLAVGVEDNLERDKSRVHFFHIASPEEPIGDPIITIQREGPEKLATAGAVAVAKRARDYLLIVGSWDSDTLDFYRSNGVALGECSSDGKSRCKFTYWQTWSKNDARKENWCDDVWGSYQNLNLISDIHDRLFLLGYYCNADIGDYVDLYSLDLSKRPSEMIRKESSKIAKCKQGASFKYGGGGYIKDEDSLVSYACERNCRDTTVINEF